MLRGILTDRRRPASVGPGRGRLASAVLAAAAHALPVGTEVRRDFAVAGSERLVACMARSDVKKRRGKKREHWVSECELESDAAWGRRLNHRRRNGAQLNLRS